MQPTERLPQCIHGTSVIGSLTGFVGLRLPTLMMTAAHLGANAMISIVMLQGGEVCPQLLEAMLQSTASAAFSFDDLTRLQDYIQRDVAARDNQDTSHSQPPCADINQSEPSLGSTSAPDVIARPAESASSLTKSVFDAGMDSLIVCMAEKRSLFSALGLLGVCRALLSCVVLCSWLLQLLRHWRSNSPSRPVSADNLGWSILTGTVKSGSRSSCLEKRRLGAKMMPYRFCPATCLGGGLMENINKMPGHNGT